MQTPPRLYCQQVSRRVPKFLFILVLLVSSYVAAFRPLMPVVPRIWEANHYDSLLQLKSKETREEIDETFAPKPVISERDKANSYRQGFLGRNLPIFSRHHIPNLLTYARCIAIPALACIFYIPELHKATSALFIAASFTDWLDGYLARRWDVSSAFGAFLDPVADKLMVSTALVLLSGHFGAIVAVPSAIILAREIAVSALREWMAQRGQRDSVKVGIQGKIKTALTMVALSVLLAVPRNGVLQGASLGRMVDLGLWLLYISSLITVTSGLVYFRAAAPALMSND